MFSVVSGMIEEFYSANSAFYTNAEKRNVKVAEVIKRKCITEFPFTIFSFPCRLRVEKRDLGTGVTCTRLSCSSHRFIYQDDRFHDNLFRI